MDRELVFAHRPFGDVHQLVFMFQSWQVLLEADLPPALQPLREIPEGLAPVITRMLREARDQLDTAQAGSEIALRFTVTPEIGEVMEWAARQFRSIGGLTQDPDLDPTWVGALSLAAEFVDEALAQLAVEPTA